MAADPDDSALAHFDPAGIIDALSTGLLILDAQLCVVHASVGAQDLLSLGLRQARGRHVGELFAQPQALIELLRRALEEVQVCSEHEFTLTTVAGVQALREPVVADLTVTPLDASITGPHLLVELVDVRARARIWRETEMLSRVDGHRLMVRQLAHEIRNPLGGLRGAAQLLERELADPGLAEYTRVIIREADRLRALVESLLGPARAPRKLRLNIHEVCEHVWQLLRTEAGPGVALERDYDPSLPEGRFDRDELVQALLNVGRNALQAVDGRGRFATGAESSFSVTNRDSGGNETSSASGYGSGPGEGGAYEVTAATPGAPIRIRWNTGEDDVAFVHHVASGRIMEVRYGKLLFAAALCE